MVYLFTERKLSYGIRCFFCMFLIVVSHHSVELSRLTIESGYYWGRFDLGSLDPKFVGFHFLSLIFSVGSILLIKKKVWSVNLVGNLVAPLVKATSTTTSFKWGKKSSAPSSDSAECEISKEQNSLLELDLAHVFTSRWLLKCPEGKDPTDQHSCLVSW